MLGTTVAINIHGVTLIIAAACLILIYKPLELQYVQEQWNFLLKKNYWIARPLIFQASGDNIVYDMRGKGKQVKEL